MKREDTSTLVVADTSPLIALALMELLPLLPELFAGVRVPEAVVRECRLDSSRPQASAIGRALAQGLLTEVAVTDRARCRLLAEVLDPGEAEAIELARELGATLLVDERKGREVARREGLRCVGSLYCLIQAKQAGLISVAAPRLERLRNHGYWLDAGLIETVLARCGE